MQMSEKAAFSKYLLFKAGYTVRGIQGVNLASGLSVLGGFHVVTPIFSHSKKT